MAITIAFTMRLVLVIVIVRLTVSTRSSKVIVLYLPMVAYM
jgi:hypothetical protein